MFKFSNIPKYFKKAQTGIEKKALQTIPIQQGSFLDFALRGRGNVSASDAMDFYRDNAAIASAVDIIGSSFEQISPILKDSDGAIIDNSEVISFLKKPNGFQTWMEFAGQLSRHFLLSGNSHISALGNVKRKPLEIYAVKPHNVSTIQDIKDSFPDRYIVPIGAGHGVYHRATNALGINRFYDGNLREIFHVMGFSSRGNNIIGDSPLNAAALEAQQQIKSNAHNLKILDNGGKLSLIVSFNDSSLIDDTEHQHRKMRINEDLAAGGIAVISAPEVNITEASSSAKDMDFAKLNELASNAIFLRYRIPLPMVTVTATTFNNMENAILQLYDQAVLPIADTLFSGLSTFLLPRFGMDPSKFRITYNQDSITPLMSRRLKELSVRQALGIETKNELREELANRDTVTGGDVLYQPANFIPLGSDITSNNNQL